MDQSEAFSAINTLGYAVAKAKRAKLTDGQIREAVEELLAGKEESEAMPRAHLCQPLKSQTTRRARR